MKYGYEYYIREVDLVGNNKVNEVHIAVEVCEVCMMYGYE